MMKIKEIPLEGAKILCPKVHVDRRGAFFELFRAAACRQAGIPEAFVQDNCSLSQRKTLRGMHFQKGQKQAKLVATMEFLAQDIENKLKSPSSIYLFRGISSPCFRRFAYKFYIKDIS